MRTRRRVHFLRAESHDRLRRRSEARLGRCPEPGTRSGAPGVTARRGRHVAGPRTPAPHGLGFPVPLARLPTSASLPRQCAETAVRGPRWGCQACAKGRWRIGRCSTRPVLKHGPRSLTCARVTGTLATKPTGATKLRGASGPFPGRIPSRSRGGRTAGPSRRHCSRGGARAHTLGPERW